VLFIINLSLYELIYLLYLNIIAFFKELCKLFIQVFNTVMKNENKDDVNNNDNK
jgi:hypothetical protein